jgi:hypothetical protein
MMKLLITVALSLTGSSLAFTPSTTTNSRAAVTTTLHAEKSQSLPFMNRPSLVRPCKFSNDTIEEKLRLSRDSFNRNVYIESTVISSHNHFQLHSIIVGWLHGR